MYIGVYINMYMSVSLLIIVFSKVQNLQNLVGQIHTHFFETVKSKFYTHFKAGQTVFGSRQSFKNCDHKQLFSMLQKEKFFHIFHCSTGVKNLFCN